MSYTEMIDIIEKAGYTITKEEQKGGETSKNYVLPGHLGSVGFITSMSDHFCSTCNRLRLMADGALKVCLFGENEVSLRDKIREGATDDDLRAFIGMAVQRKKEAHGGSDGMYGIDKNKKLNRPMILIGG